MALLKEKVRVEKEELKLKAKIEKEQIKEKHRLDEEEKRRSREKGKDLASSLDIGSTSVTAPVATEVERPVSSGAQIATGSARRASTSSSDSLGDSSDDGGRPATGKSVEDNGIISPASPSKRQSKVKSWFAGRFRSSSKTAKDSEDGDTNRPGFIGGASLTGAGFTGEAGESNPKEASMQNVALAGKPTPVHKLVTKPRPDEAGGGVNESQERRPSNNRSISTLSKSDDEASGRKEKRTGRLGFKDRLLGKMNTKSSNETDNDEFEEARDTFEEDKLVPPPRLVAGSAGGKASGSPVRDSRFSEIL
jgi:hypothetical protein